MKARMVGNDLIIQHEADMQLDTEENDISETNTSECGSNISDDPSVLESVEDLPVQNLNNWRQEIILTAVENAAIIGHDENYHHSRPIYKHCLRLMRYTPSITCVMSNVFQRGLGTAKSANVESSFFEVKEVDLRRKIIRADIFVNKQFDATTGKLSMNLGNLCTTEAKLQINRESTPDVNQVGNEACISNNDNILQEEDPEVVINLDDYQYDESESEHDMESESGSANSDYYDAMERNSSERWRHVHEEEQEHIACDKNTGIASTISLAKTTPKTRISKYKRARPAALCKDDSRNCREGYDIGKLINGNFRLKSVKIGMQYYLVKNSCAFDSVSQCLAAIYCDSHQAKTFTDKYPDDPYIDFIKSMIENVNEQTYTKRCEVLLTTFQTSPILGGNNHHTLDCFSNITRIINDLCSNIVSGFEIKRCSEPMCVERTLSTRFIQIDPEVLTTYGMRELQKAVKIDSHECMMSCNMVRNMEPCDGFIKTELVTFPIIAIEPYLTMEEIRKHVNVTYE
jgi:hypothetical protein